MNEGITVFVGMSGGVDSSVSAALLKDAGYHVVGVFIRVWEPDWLDTCTWRSDRRDAISVCAQLDIPFLDCNLEVEYERDVVAYMIEEYKQGRTPNPDVMCNKSIKFGAFLSWACEQGADMIATGHYARVFKDDEAIYHLCEGKDPNKDQSYFLWTLGQHELARTLFPIGGLEKDEVRKLAEKYELPVATKHDSQGICFLGKVDIKEFLSHYIETYPGDVIDEKGNVIGTHPGALFFTLGERHGFTVTQEVTDRKALYVIDKDIFANTLTVAGAPRVSDLTQKGSVVLSRLNDITGMLQGGEDLFARLRYRGEKIPVTIEATDGTSATLALGKHDTLPARGQSLVFYRNEECLGGGIVA